MNGNSLKFSIINLFSSFRSQDYFNIIIMFYIFNTFSCKGGIIMSKDTIEINKNTIWQITTFVFAILFVISLFTGGFGIGSSKGIGNAVVPSQPSNPSPSQP